MEILKKRELTCQNYILKKGVNISKLHFKKRKKKGVNISKLHLKKRKEKELTRYI